MSSLEQSRQQLLRIATDAVLYNRQAHRLRGLDHIKGKFTEKEGRDSLRRSRIFFDVANSILLEDTSTDEDERDFSSFFTGVYSAFVSGELENFLKIHAHTDTIQAGIDTFLRRIEKKVAKSKNTVLSSYQRWVSFGYEGEYYDQTLVEMMCLENYVSRLKQSNPNYFLKMVGKPWSQFTWEGYLVDAIIPNIKMPIYKMMFPRVKKQAQKLYPRIPSKIKFNSEITKESPFLTDKFSEGLFPQSLEDGLERSEKVREVRSKPTYSARQALREFFWLKKAGAITDRINFHFTYGGVRLKESDPEFMDVTLMSAAAGFLPEKLLDAVMDDQESDQNTTDGDVLSMPHVVFTETTKKSNFPLHSQRFSTQLIPVTQDNEKNFWGTERRSVFHYDDNEYPLLVKDVLFSEAAAIAKAAHQAYSKSKVEEKLSKLWEELMCFWKGSAFDIHKNKLPTHPEKKVTPAEFWNSKENCQFAISNPKTIINILQSFGKRGLRNKSEYFSANRQQSGTERARYMDFFTELYLDTFTEEMQTFRLVVKMRIQAFIRDVYDCVKNSKK